MNQQIPLTLLAAGLSFIPVDRVTRIPIADLLPIAYDKDGKPIIRVVNGVEKVKHEYKTYMQRQPTEDEVKAWYSSPNDYNLAILPGKVSGGLVIFDFDYDAETVFSKWQELVRASCDGLLEKLVIVRTGKGYHVYFRCPEFSHKNNCIAKKDNPDKPKSPHILIEIKNTIPCTAPPSWHHGTQQHYRTIQGTLRNIAILSLEEANSLLGCAVSLNEVKEREYKPKVEVYQPSRILSANDNSIEGYRILSYARAVLRGLASDLACRDGYRNATLNTTAFILGTWYNISGLSYGECETALRFACEQNGLIRENGQHSFYASMQSGWKAGLTQAKTHADIQPIFASKEILIADGELASRFQEIQPPLTEEQLSQAVLIGKEIQDKAYWKGYHEGMNEAQKRLWFERYGFDEGIQAIFGLGYRGKRICEETGEITGSAYTVPMRNYKGEVVNVEYVMEEGGVRYEQEEIPSLGYLVNACFELKDAPVLVLPDNLGAIDTMLNMPSGFNYAGLPQLGLRPESIDGLSELPHIVVIEPGTKVNSGLRYLPRNTKTLRLPYPLKKLRELTAVDGVVSGEEVTRFILRTAS